MSGSLTAPPVSSTPVDQGFISGLSPSVMAWLGPAAQDESGGNATATNPNSTAAGLYQFTQPTWNGLVQQYGKQYGLTPDGRTDARQARLGAQLIAQNQYLPALRDVGITNPGPDDIQQVHFWGAPTFKKLYGANSPNTPLRQVLGQDFNGIYSANASLFGNNPNITVGQAGAAVDAHMPAGYGSTSMLPAQFGGKYAGDNQPLSGSAAPQPGVLASSNLPAPSALPQQSAPQTTPYKPSLSPETLLRMASGAFSGRTFMQSLAGATAQAGAGMDEDKQSYIAQQSQMQQQAALAAYRQGSLANDTMRNQLDAQSLAQNNYHDRMQAYTEMVNSGGMSPAMAAQVTGFSPADASQTGQSGQPGPTAPPSQPPQLPPSSSLPAPQSPQGQQVPGGPQQYPMSPAYAQAQINSAKQQQATPQQGPQQPPATQGFNPAALGMYGQSKLLDTYVDPSNNQPWQQYQVGPNKQAWYNPATGQTAQTAPSDVVAANNPGYAQGQKDDATALNNAYTAIAGQQATINNYKEMYQLAGQVPSGTTLEALIGQHANSWLGTPGMNAQQVMQNLQSQAQVNEQEANKMGGRLDLQQVIAMNKAVPNMQMSPQVMQFTAATGEARAAWQEGPLQAYQALSPAQQAQTGFRAFQYKWQQKNNLDDFTANYLKQNYGDLLAALKKPTQSAVPAYQGKLAASGTAARQQQIQSMLFPGGS